MRVESTQRPVQSAAGLTRVSVVIPNYNYGRFLAEAVGSALSQAGVDVDVTILDDASTDDSVAVAEALVAADSRVRLVRHLVNTGHIRAFNDALEAGTGRYIVKLDADDILPSGALARSTALLDAHPEVTFVYGRPEVFTDRVPDLPATASQSWTVWPGEQWIASRIRRIHNPIMQPEVVIRRTALLAAGGHLDSIPEASDFNLWLRLAAIGAIGRVNGPVQGFYRVHRESMRHTIHAGLLSDLTARWRAMELFLEQHGGERQWRAAARSMSRDAVRLAARSCDRGTPDPQAGTYLEFAAALDPRVTASPAWAAARLRLGLYAAGRGRLARHVPGAAVRDLEDRIRWRRWRRTGL